MDNIELNEVLNRIMKKIIDINLIILELQQILADEKEDEALYTLADLHTKEH